MPYPLSTWHKIMFQVIKSALPIVINTYENVTFKKTLIVGIASND